MLRTISRAVCVVRTKWHRLGRDDSGSVITFLIVAPVLAGVLAIGVQTGQLYSAQRQMQNASDDAALSGSIDRMAGKSNSAITTDALYEAQRNGFTNGVNSVSVTVNVPPQSGPNINTAGSVEVIVTKPASFSLAGVLNAWLGNSSGNNSFTMQTRSVAAQSTVTSSATSYEGCMTALTPNAEQGINFTSFNSFTSDCTLMSNGTSSTANSNASVYMASFNSASMKAVWTRGSFYATGYSSLNPVASAAQTNQATSVVDPYGTGGVKALATPAPGTCSFTSYSPSSGQTLQVVPGTYCGGLTISSYNTVNFLPGTYYIANGDLYISSVNTVACPTCTGTDGVTFVLTQTTGNSANIGGVKISSENSVTLNAPSVSQSTSKYPYPGVLFYQDRNAPIGTMSSTSKIFTLSSLNTAALTGAIYFPNNLISISSLNSVGTNTTGCTIWIGRYLKFSSFNSAYKAGCPAAGTTPVGIQTTTTVTKGRVFE